MSGWIHNILMTIIMQLQSWFSELKLIRRLIKALNEFNIKIRPHNNLNFQNEPSLHWSDRILKYSMSLRIFSSRFRRWGTDCFKTFVNQERTWIIHAKSFYSKRGRKFYEFEKCCGNWKKKFIIVHFLYA